MTHVADIAEGYLLRNDTSELTGVNREVVVFEHALADVADLDDAHLARIIERAAGAGPMHYNLRSWSRAANPAVASGCKGCWRARVKR